MNRVCFCFPFPFFFPTVPALCPPLSPSPCAGPSPGVDAPLPPDPFLPPLFHAGWEGALSPRMFRSDWFPPIAAFGTRGVLVVDTSSGNADLESEGPGPVRARDPGPGTDVGARGVWGAGLAVTADAAAHGVRR